MEVRCGEGDTLYGTMIGSQSFSRPMSLACNNHKGFSTFLFYYMKQKSSWGQKLEKCSSLKGDETLVKSFFWKIEFCYREHSHIFHDYSSSPPA